MLILFHLPFTGEPIFLALQQIIREARIESSKTELSQALKRTAMEKGFAISDNQGEGNCMFFALSEQLELIKGIKISRDELRRIIVQHLRENPKLVITLFFFIIFQGGHFCGIPTWPSLNSKQFNSTNINHKGLQRTANEYAEKRRIYKDLISKNEK